MRLYIQEKSRVNLMKAHIGIDVSKATLDVCHLIDAIDKKYERATFNNNKQGFIKLLKWMQNKTKVELNECQVVLEATGVYHLQLANTLKTKGIVICLVNPLQSYHFAKSLGMRAKTDSLDGVMLAQYSWERNPTEWQPSTKERVELKALNLRLDAVEKDIRRETNRLESAVIADQSVIVVKLIKRSIASLEKQVEKLNELIGTQIEAHEELKRDRKLLLSIKGIGDVCSRYLVAEIYQGRFRSASQCAAYMGLVPVPQQSGTSEKVSLSKAGNRKIKAKLYMAAISAKQHNPIIKLHYDRLIARGKCKMSALCAAMRRLVQICYGVIKHQKEFCLQPS